MGERRDRRKFTAEQKLEIVLAGIKTGNVSEVCRQHGIANTQYYDWRDQFLQGGLQGLKSKFDQGTEPELKKKIAELERALGRKTYELEIAGKFLRDGE